MVSKLIFFNIFKRVTIYLKMQTALYTCLYNVYYFGTAAETLFFAFLSRSYCYIAGSAQEQEFSNDIQKKKARRNLIINNKKNTNLT